MPDETSSARAMQKQINAPSPSLFSRFSFAVSGGHPKPEEREWTYTNELNERQLDEMWTRQDALSFLDATYGTFNIIRKGLNAVSTSDNTKYVEEGQERKAVSTPAIYGGTIPFRILFDLVIFLLRHSKWKLGLEDALEIWTATVQQAPSPECKDLALSWWGGYTIHLDAEEEKEEDGNDKQQRATKAEEDFMRQIAAVQVLPYDDFARMHAREEKVRFCNAIVRLMCTVLLIYFAPLQFYNLSSP